MPLPANSHTFSGLTQHKTITQTQSCKYVLFIHMQGITESSRWQISPWLCDHQNHPVPRREIRPLHMCMCVYEHCCYICTDQVTWMLLHQVSLKIDAGTLKQARYVLELLRFSKWSVISKHLGIKLFSTDCGGIKTQDSKAYMSFQHDTEMCTITFSPVLQTAAGRQQFDTIGWSKHKCMQTCWVDLYTQGGVCWRVRFDSAVGAKIPDVLLSSVKKCDKPHQPHCRAIWTFHIRRDQSNSCQRREQGSGNVMMNGI